MKQSILLIFSLILIFFTGCRSEETGKIPGLKSLFFPSIAITDSLVTVPYEKGYLLKAGNLGNQYSYSDLTKLEDGTLLAASITEKQISDFTSKYMVISESKDKGKTWSSPVRINHTVTDSFLNVSAPNLLNFGGGHIMLIFGMKYDSKRIDIMYKESWDGGKTWGDDKVVFKPDQGYITLNNDRAIFINGRIIIPVAKPDYPDDLNRSIYNGMSVFYYYSDDMGTTWQKSSSLSVAGTGLLEPGITQIDGNELLMNIRLNTGTVLFARSQDMGVKWNYETSTIKSPSSPQKILRLKESGTLVMVWNNTDVNPAAHAGNRNPLSLAISRNGGRDWIYLMDLENNPGYDFSYPTMYQDINTLYITYYEVSAGKAGYSIKLVKIDKKYLD